MSTKVESGELSDRELVSRMLRSDNSAWKLFRKRYDRLSYLDVLAQDLRVMDASAISLMRENAIPIVVFSIRRRGALLDVLNGTGVYTTIAEEPLDPEES